MPNSPHAAVVNPALVHAIARDLSTSGIAQVDGLLPDALLRALHDACVGAESDGALRAAGVGRGAQQRHAPVLRGDAILWLEREARMSSPSPREDFLDHMDALRIALNRELMLGLHELEAHFASYPAGTGYARHRDRFRDDDLRVLSLVVYLNPEWQAEDGGALRLHLDDGIRDVAPRAGTSVLFLSDAIDHEVLPARRTRRSIAGWFRQRPLASPTPTPL